MLALGFFLRGPQEEVAESSAETQNSSTVSSQARETALAPMTLGSEDAPVTIVEYADFLCPYCAQYHNEVSPEVERDYIETGKVKFEFRPISYLTEDSSRAAELAYCANDQGKFWDYHDYIYEKTWSDFYSKGVRANEVSLFKDDYVTTIAKEIQANSEELQTCLDEGRHKATIENANNEAQENGVRGTPHFTINDKPYSGFAPYPVIKTTIESFL